MAGLKIRYNSPYVLTFALICAVVLLLDVLLAGSITPLVAIDGHFSFGSITDYLTLVTHVFGHANGQHLLGNMTFILLLGPVLEEKYGGQNLAFMALITALITGILQNLLFSQGLLGASGIVFMLIMLVSFTNVKEREIPLTFILIFALFIGKEIYNSFQPNYVSEFAHIIGGIAGSVFGFFASPPRAKAAGPSSGVSELL